MTLRQTALDILRFNTHPDRAESAPSRRRLPEEAVNNATPDSLRAFVEVFEEISHLLPPSHYRTRYTDRTRTLGYGITFYTRSTDSPHRTARIQSVLLPTKQDYAGCLEAYIAGHDESPVTSDPVAIYPRWGTNEYWIIDQPSPRLVRELVQAFHDSALFDMIERDE